MKHLGLMCPLLECVHIEPQKCHLMAYSFQCLILKRICKRVMFYLGFTNVETACCGTISSTRLVPCSFPFLSVCQDRSKYFYWDAFHPTQAAYEIIAHEMFDGTEFISPTNIRQLMGAWFMITFWILRSLFYTWVIFEWISIAYYPLLLKSCMDKLIHLHVWTSLSMYFMSQYICVCIYISLHVDYFSIDVKTRDRET